VSRSAPIFARGDRGSATVAAVVLMISIVGGSLFWLTWDVDRAVNAAADADAVAFQAARAGAQAIEPASLRAGTPGIDPEKAERRADDAAAALFEANLMSGRVTSVVVTGDRLTVVVELVESGRRVTGQASVRLAVGVEAEEP
jgi:hypothetical protein